MRDQVLIYSLGLSALVHLMAVSLIAVLASAPSPPKDHVVIDIIDLPPRVEKTDPPALPKPAPKPAKVEATASTPPAPPPVPRVTSEEFPAKQVEPENPAAASSAPGGGDSQSVPGGAPGRGAGVENFPGSGDLAVKPGSGLGKSGAGRGENPPGPGIGERGSRPAKPLLEVKASYPPMALRMGLQADVTLRIFIDAEGRVTKADVVKSAGGGFDNEALKAIKQFRFEPAVSDGKRVAAEFIYVYRFRIAR
jgi:protein TonB